MFGVDAGVRGGHAERVGSDWGGGWKPHRCQLRGGGLDGSDGLAVDIEAAIHSYHYLKCI